MNKQRLLQEWLEWEAERPDLERHLIQRAFGRLRQGTRAEVVKLACELEVSVASLREYAQQLTKQGRITMEGDTVTGAGGLSIIRTSHLLVLAGRPLYTWCAWDAVGIPAAFGADATITSSYVDGGGVQITVAAGIPTASNAVWVRMAPPGQERHRCGGT